MQANEAGKVNVPLNASGDVIAEMAYKNNYIDTSVFKDFLRDFCDSFGGSEEEILAALRDETNSEMQIRDAACLWNLARKGRFQINNPFLKVNEEIASSPDKDLVIGSRQENDVEVMVSLDGGQAQALALRTKALALLQEAQVIDGLKPYIVMHEHDSGTSGYMAWFDREPNEEEAAAVLDAEFEPDREEVLTIESSVTLDELTAVSLSARL